MAHWQQVTEFVVRLPHRAGELARLCSQLRSANVEILSYFGPSPGNQADGFHLVPADAEKFREFAAANGLGTWEEPCFYLSGRYHDGELVGTLESIAGEGINIQFVNAFESGGQLGILIWVDDTDVDRLSKILGIA